MAPWSVAESWCESMVITDELPNLYYYLPHGPSHVSNQIILILKKISQNLNTEQIRYNRASWPPAT